MTLLFALIALPFMLIGWLISALLHMPWLIVLAFFLGAACCND